MLRKCTVIRKTIAQSVLYIRLPTTSCWWYIKWKAQSWRKHYIVKNFCIPSNRISFGGWKYITYSTYHTYIPCILYAQRPSDEAFTHIAQIQSYTYKRSAPTPVRREHPAARIVGQCCACDATTKQTVNSVGRRREVRLARLLVLKYQETMVWQSSKFTDYHFEQYTCRVSVYHYGAYNVYYRFSRASEIRLLGNTANKQALPAMLCAAIPRSVR